MTIDQDGLVLITDTGNNRIVVFTQDGEFVNEFGNIGINPGEFDEPVGIAVDEYWSIIRGGYLEPAHPGLLCPATR